ncbi:hypothetical protein Cgig2_020698 [Carnegiea gigantea]|uniref:Uncharacterized protein n=1 Tax=Carnegiea gigantea TaxID=171969 RepID=A0A9Q1GT09_9CARY|nr:hypothetical protein Cgig2_020698 [Carnegiea gigantea]
MGLEPDVDKQIKAIRQIFLYKDRMDSFGSSIAQRAITSLMLGTEEELTEFFNPINLDYIFDDDGPLNLWLSEKEQPLNLDENKVNAAINIIEDDDPQPDAPAPFRYSVDQQPQDMQGSDYESEGHFLPSSSHGGSGGGGDGGNGGANKMGAAYSFRQSTDYFTDRGRGVPVEDDRRRRRSPDKQPREPTQTYRRVRKGKELVQPHGYPIDAMYGYTDFQEVPSNFTGPGLFAHSGGYDTYGGVLNNYGYS